MSEFTAEPVLACQARLGEGPVWDERHQALWFVDIEGRMLQRWAPETDLLERWQLPQRVGCALPTADAELLIIGCDRGLYRYRLGEQPVPIVDPEPEADDHRFNDGKVDPHGNLWAGTMVMGGEPNTAALYRLDPTGTLSRQLAGIQISNGLAWNADGSRMYYIDTPTRRVDRLRCDPTTGELGDREACVEIAAADGHPDGMCIDDHGLLWVAHWGGHQVIAYDPSDGSIRHRVRVAAPNVTSCCWGGRARDTLFITTAGNGVDRDEFPHAGDVFAVQPGATGPLPTWFPISA